MRNLWLLVFLVFISAGCVTVANSVIPAAPVVVPSDRVSLGMTRPMVTAILDIRVAVDNKIDPLTGVSKPVDVQSLYSSELVRIGATVYQVDRYLLRPPMMLGHITEADLFAVVYKDGLVVARGRDAVKNLERGPVEK